MIVTSNRFIVLCLAILAIFVLAGCSNSAAGDPVPEEPVQDTTPACGDGIVQAGEQCDDGNGVNDDLCSNVCRDAICGDTIVQVSLGEECDDGNADGGDGCSAVCTWE